MAVTATDIAQQMMQQLRVLDPAISAEPGTPERKIIDTVAYQIASNQLDLTLLDSGLNIDGKLGSNLDNFLAIFNFGRQAATFATGFVTFSRPNSPATRDIRIPTGTRVVAPLDSGDIFFRTSFDVVLRTGSTSVVAPITAVVAGTSGNVAANTITEFLLAEGIFAVTNDLATSGGIDLETDDALKVRFKNTVFRNLAGTYDQYLALAVATPFTTKANVVGPISRYREYIQVPDKDDSNVGNGTAGHWTTSMSTIPYSKHVYTTVPFFLSNGQFGANAVFYRPDTDFVVNTNTTAKNAGDAFSDAANNVGEVYWNPLDNANQYRPSVTFLNVYTGGVVDVTAIRPGQVVLFEHSYMSSASRNDWNRKVLNAVDVFIDGGNDTVASTVIPRPTSANIFVDDASHRYYFQNYRRIGKPDHRPVIGNLFTPLFFAPVTDIPDIISVDDVNYYRDVHYWLVEDISELHGTVRARNGIEWDKYLAGEASGDSRYEGQTLNLANFTGATIAYGDDSGENDTIAPAITIDSYTYDKNIADLQAIVEANKQVTTDVLVHKSRARYFKLDITVMYTAGANVASANQSIYDAVGAFFKDQYFGTAIQLSDLLQTIHNVPTVDNVRWSRDVPTVGDEIDETRNRVIGVNVDGSPRLNMVADYLVAGSTTRGQRAQMLMYFTGSPTTGSLTINANSGSYTYNDITTITAGDLTTRLSTLYGVSVTVTGSGTPTAPFIATFADAGFRTLPTFGVTGLVSESVIYNSDFFLQDDELPALPDAMQDGDTVPGLIIRPRAQNTWVRLRA